jgi:hypothetical protein
MEALERQYENGEIDAGTYQKRKTTLLNNR